jgi:hypothetical protein
MQTHAPIAPTTETVAGVNWLVTEFCLRNDRPEFGSVAELFKVDGVLQLGPLRIEGRAAIAAFFTKRNAALTLNLITLGLPEKRIVGLRASYEF